MTLEGRTAIITGATEGIGLATSRLLAREGARLVLVARRPEPGAALVGELGEQRAAFLAGDVADLETPAAAVALAQERFGQLDVLVNNAGLDFVCPILDATPEDVQRVYEVTVFGALRMLQAPSRRRGRRDDRRTDLRHHKGLALLTRPRAGSCPTPLASDPSRIAAPLVQGPS
jgi:meso-butanediol dehydrogenase / (S,S)-butanediol dehydrogenase / diacetyl reductase